PSLYCAVSALPTRPMSTLFPYTTLFRSLPSSVIREYIVGALDFIVQGERLSDGSRKIMSISEVVKTNDNQMTVNEIFKFKRTGVGENGKVMGYFTSTGNVPRCLNRLKVMGIDIDESIFETREVETGDHFYSL